MALAPNGELVLEAAENFDAASLGLEPEPAHRGVKKRKVTTEGVPLVRKRCLPDVLRRLVGQKDPTYEGLLLVRLYLNELKRPILTNSSSKHHLYARFVH